MVNAAGAVHHGGYFTSSSFHPRHVKNFVSLTSQPVDPMGNGWKWEGTCIVRMDVYGWSRGIGGVELSWGSSATCSSVVALSERSLEYARVSPFLQSFSCGSRVMLDRR